jgi:MFS family permease
VALVTEGEAAIIGETSSRDPVSLPQHSQRYAWYVVGALSFVNLASYVERMIPTLLFGPIKQTFGINDTQVSLLAGLSFVLFYLVFGLVIGRLADRFNRRRIIMVGIVLWSAATAVCGLAQSFVQLFIARVSVGVGEATLGPSAISMISDYFQENRVARALSIYSGSQYMGAGLALVLGGLVVQLVAQLPPLVLPVVGAVEPWQVTFLLIGTLGLVVLVPMLFVREPARRGLAPALKAYGGAGVPFSELWAFVKLNRRTFISFYAAFAIYSIHGFGTVAWIPSYFVRVYGWQIQSIGYVYGLMVAILGAAGVVVGARFFEWLLARGYTDAYFRTPLIVIAVVIAPQILATLMPTATLSLCLLAFCSFVGTFSVALPAAALQAITPNQMRGQMVAALMFVSSILGLGLGPTVVAVITDFVFGNELAVGYALSTTTAIVLPIVAILLWLGLRPLRESLARAKAWSVLVGEGV